MFKAHWRRFVTIKEIFLVSGLSSKFGFGSEIWLNDGIMMPQSATSAARNVLPKKGTE